MQPGSARYFLTINDEFQSLKRDIPLCNAPSPLPVDCQSPSFNRSSATSLYATPLGFSRPVLSHRSFNRSSATSLYATTGKKTTRATPRRFQSLKRDIPLCNLASFMPEDQPPPRFQSLKRDIPLCNLGEP